MMFWFGNDVSGWGYALMIVSMVLFWSLIIASIVAVFRYLGRGPQPPTSPSLDGNRPAPEQVLAERFARGEIDEAEYQQKLETMRGKKPTRAVRP